MKTRWVLTILVGCWVMCGGVTYAADGPGDVNCDGIVDYADIDVFVAALGCAGGDPGCWPFDCPWINADCDGDGEVTYADIDAFVALIGTVYDEGACCSEDGACTVEREGDCSGVWQGVGTTCDPNPCPQPEGACCNPNGLCAVTTAVECTGLYQGDGTDCVPNPCEPYCPEATILVEVKTDIFPGETRWMLIDQATELAIASGGPYPDPDVVYVQEVCVPYIDCYDFTIYDEWGDGICCSHGDGYYNVYFEGELVATGGTFTSEETTHDVGGCYFEGACCFADGSCTAPLTEEVCEGAGGTYAGNSTTCSPNPCPQPGACCWPDGSCTEGLETECGAVWQGAGVTCAASPCASYGACCVLDGSCGYVQQAACSGVWQGEGTTCEPNPCPQPPLGACCLPDGACRDDMTEAQCQDASGTYQGDEVSCATVTCPQPAGPIPVQMAGNALTQYPYFEYVKAFNENAPLEVAVDPTVQPGIVGRTGDIYVVEAKTATGWAADPSLVDVTSGGALTVTFDGDTIQVNTFTVAAAYDLDSSVYEARTGDYTGLGHGYDVVLDFNRNGQLDCGDYIDGYGDEAGLYMVSDTSADGPLAVTETLYSGGMWLDQDLYYPTAIATMGQLPVIVISHGNGHNYQWYDHIGYHMASYGFVVMSHSNYTGPGIESASTTTLTNTDYLLGHLSSIAGGALQGHVDGHRIMWIGHSRGGEGITRAYDRLYDEAYLPTYFTIDDVKLLSSMLPTDFLSTANSNPHDVNYHLWTASGDSDVWGGASDDIAQTFHLHERATNYRQSTVVQGTGHGDFHASTGSVFTGPCHIEPKSVVHDIMQGYFLPLAKHYLDGNIPAQDFLWRQYEHFHPIGVDTSNPCIVVSHEYRNGSAVGNFMIDDFEMNASTAVSSSGGSVSFTVQNLTEGRLDDNDSDFSYMPGDPFNGATQDSSSGQDNGHGIVFDWNDADSYIEWAIVADQRDLSDDLYLSFRGAQGTRHPYTLAEMGDLTLSVTLRDGDDTTSSINIGAYGGGLEQPYDRSRGWHNEMEVIRIRLADFLHNGSGLDLTDIRAVRLDVGPSWGSTKGRIVVDEVMITNDVPSDRGGVR